MKENTVQVTNEEWNCRVKEIGENEMQEFFDWLQGKNKIDRMTFVEQPKLSKESAFSIIYYLQERLGILEDKYELCKECGCIYDSENEGTHIGDDTLIMNEDGEEIEANFPEEMYGFYCDNCRND